MLFSPLTSVAGRGPSSYDLAMLIPPYFDRRSNDEKTVHAYAPLPDGNTGKRRGWRFH